MRSGGARAPSKPLILHPWVHEQRESERFLVHRPRERPAFPEDFVRRAGDWCLIM